MKFEDRFTERAKNVLNLAHEAAANMGHGYVGSEHILLGIASDGGGSAAKVLRDAGLDKELIEDSIEKFVGRGESGTTTVQGLTPRAKRIIEIAVAEATRLGHNYVGTEHLLMGILREYDSVASKIITASGADPNKLYTDIINVFSSSAGRRPQEAQRVGANHSETKTLDQ